MIPDRPLNFDPQRMTIDQTIMMAGFIQVQKIDIGLIADLKALLVECTDWTAQEIGAIRLGEFVHVLEKLNEAGKEEQAEAVPPPIESSCATTAQER